jgi:hypothetical protein
VEEATKMTSKGKQPEDQEPEIDWAELLLRRFRKAEEVFEKAREYNRSHGFDERLSKAYTNYSKPLAQKSYERFLDSVTNVDTGEWNTIKYLRATKQISRVIESEFEDVSYPRVELLKIIRIKTQSGGDFIYRVLNLVGLGRTGKEITQFVDDIDLEKIPAVEYIPLPVETIQGSGYEEEGYGRTMIASVSNDNKIYSGIETAKTTYLVPMSEQTIREWIKDVKSFVGPNATALVLKDENASHRTSARSLEEFLMPFDETFKRHMAPQTNINLKDLVDQLKPKDANAEQQKLKSNLHTNRNVNINIWDSTPQDSQEIG